MGFAGERAWAGVAVRGCRHVLRRMGLGETGKAALSVDRAERAAFAACHL